MKALSDEVRRLAKKWDTSTSWKKRLEWIEIQDIRGWRGQRVSFKFPIVAIVGENGSGKSTVLQAAASVHQVPKDTARFFYPSTFFPSTAWDMIRGVSIRFGYMEGEQHHSGSIRKPTSRWLGHDDRPTRSVTYVDLSRLQPVSVRTGYQRIAKTKHKEASFSAFDDAQVRRLSQVMGRPYDSARMALSDIDDKRHIPVLSKEGKSYSGFHQGAGETTITELLESTLPTYGLVLIDEIESSLHPRAQRRLVRHLADRCRAEEMQAILTTHSPYVLEELPPQARVYILESHGMRQIVEGVSPQFAMTQMDDEPHPDVDVYVEDVAAKTMLTEIMARFTPQFVRRCALIPCGAASVGQALGQMVEAGRFPRPSCVFLDGDSAPSPGCNLLPGDDAPERVVFGELKKKSWGDLWSRIGRDIASVTDACNRATILGDHHDWADHAANELMCGAEALWQAMCSEWARKCLSEDVARDTTDPILDVLEP